MVLFAGAAQAAGNISFGGAPAVQEVQAPLAQAAKGAALVPAAKNGGQVEQLPGVSRAIFSPVTPLEAEQAIKSRGLPADLNSGAVPAVKTKDGAAVLSAMRISGDTAAAGPASIAELARALKNNPDLIYEYVRNNVETVPIWGIQKGDVGAILDNQGTAFDQAQLMVSLLRQAGYTANFVKGQVNLTAAQVQDWLGIDTSKVCAVLNLLANGQIPVASVTASAAGSCPTSTASLVSLKVSHVWVKATIDGSTYYFDPSFKPHALQAGLDLATVTGYNAAGYLTAAKTGTTLTADYIQNPNRTNIRNNLTGYANSLATYLRTNKPAAVLDDIVGGKTVTPYVGAPLRQTSLPYQDTSVVLTEWVDIPSTYKPTLRIQYSGIDKSYTSDAIYGKRLSITYNGSNQPVLSLDGTAVATGTAVTLGSNGTVNFTVTHPYAQAFANQAFSQSIKAGGTFLVGNGWGPAGRGLVEHHRGRLDAAKAAGGADASEAVLGSSLAVLSSTWIAQVNQADYITDRLAKTNTLFHHQIGIAGYNTAPYVDLPGNMLSIASEVGDAAKQTAVFYSASMHASIFESTAVQQVNGVSAVSTVKLIDIAAANGDKIFDAKSANYASVVKPAMLSCAANQLTSFQNAVGAGRRLILPTRCNIAENSWSGSGYFDINAAGSSIGAIIGGGLAGGFSSASLSTSLTANNSLLYSISPDLLTQYSGTSFGDPIDMVKGSYLYAKNDITAGVGEFPSSLSLQKLYTSGARTSAGPLGKGWTHNFASSVAVGSDGFQGLGEDSALDAVSTIVESMVSLDLMSDTAKPLDKMVVATLGQRWFGDQLINNTVIVRQGLNGEVFVKLPDGSYNAPPGNAAKLTLGGSTYTYETLHKAKLNFNALNATNGAGKIATYVHPSGLQANFTYSGNDLTQVQNSLGRTLTITNTSGRITQVADGTRNVKYVYDASGNLVTFTDATAKNTTFQYDQPGRLTKVFYPSNPTLAFLTNVYDTLGRVQTQTNANGKVYTYYFAGSRSEEVAPGSISKVSYLDALGKVTKTIDPVGRVVNNFYDGQSRLISSTLPEGNSVQYTYDDAPCLAQKRCTHNVKTVSQVAKPATGLATLTSSFTYESAFNQVASATDPRGKITNYTYTAQGLPLTVTSPADDAGVRPSTTFGYTAFTPAGFPALYLQTSATAKVDATNTVVTATTYNAANKYVPATVVVDSGTGKLNLATTFTYDSFGNLTVVNGPRSDVTDTVTTAYDAERRPITLTNALGKVTQQGYDADGRGNRTAAQIGTQWLVSCQTYTPSGKLLKSWGPAQTAAATTCPSAASPTPVTDYAYDNLDRLTQVTEALTAGEGGNRVTQTAYYADDRVQNVKRAVGTALAQTYAVYTYTPNGLLLTQKDAKNNLTANQYDGHDRKIKTRYPDPVTANLSSTTDYEQYAYDNNGNVTSLRKRNGQSITLVYDNLNRLVARNYPTAADNVAFAYDLLNRKTAANYANASYNVGYVWDAAGRLANTTAGGKTVAYQYDAAGNRTRTTWPEATPFYVTATFDALNRPTAIKELGATNLATYAYDDLSRRSTVTLGNGTTTTYGYSTTQGALSSLTHNLAGTAQDQTYTYARNQAREIVTHGWNNDLYQWSTSNSNKAYTANGLNQYTAVGASTLTYDGNGNLAGDGVWSYGYDLDNRLKTATKTGYSASLAYDAAGRLRQTTLGGTITNLLYDGVDLIAEYDGANAVLRRYVHGPGIDEALVWYEGSGTTNKTWLYADHQGSIVGQANAGGTSTAIYSYGPFGEPNATTGSRFRYTGQQYLGALGLYYYKARFYSPQLGRFLQTDPIGYADDNNLYAYVGNGSVNATDPTGLFVMQVGAGIVGGVGGVLFQAGADLLSGKVSSFGNYAGALVGGAAGGVAAVSCGPACAGAIAGAASSATQQFIDRGSISVGRVAVDAGLGVVGGAVLGKVVPYAGKNYLSNSTKRDIGEGLSEVSIRATGGQIAERNSVTNFGKSNLDFKMTNGSYVESKFGTSVPKGQQKAAIDSGKFNGYMGDDVVHFWTYPTVSGIAASPFASAAAGNCDGR
jgi:RHS repeat-associated protein